jgi:hypothetical protein
LYLFILFNLILNLIFYSHLSRYLSVIGMYSKYALAQFINYPQYHPTKSVNSYCYRKNVLTKLSVHTWGCHCIVCVMDPVISETLDIVLGSATFMQSQLVSVSSSSKFLVLKCLSLNIFYFLSLTDSLSVYNMNYQDYFAFI